MGGVGMNRRPAHPLGCDCAPCRLLHRHYQPHACSTCQWTGRCDAEIKVHSLTDHLIGLGFFAEGERGITDAAGKACRKWKGK